MNECDVFMQALDIEDPQARRTFLDEACQDDRELRRRVDALLKSHGKAGSLLEHPVIQPLATELLDGVETCDNSTKENAIPQLEKTSLDFLEPSQAPHSLGRLGKYEILEVLGRGGMGIVLKGHDTKLHRVVAVKVLTPELASNVTARKRFEKEAQAAAAVSHDHVVTIFEVENHVDDPAERFPHLVMEFIDGPSLQQKIEKHGPLELREILRIGQQVAAGLSAAHRQGLIHRDVKPGNILLQNGVQRVQITDFGLARAVDDVGITRTGEVTGTPQYMSPEQAQGQPLDPRSDLFSLGSVMYAMCTGRSPFRADTTVAALRRVCDDEPRPIREINPDIPVWLVEIIDNLLAKDPDDRFQSAAEVSELLTKCLARVQQDGAASMPDLLLPWKKKSAGGRKIRPRRRWAVAAMVLIALGLTIGATEATGVTHLSSTVIRIMTGEGTLVVEVDDPSVEVSIDGEELSITGAGLREIKLRPGQYRFTATKDGQPIEQKLVSISRGRQQIVRISHEMAGTLPADSTQRQLFIHAHALAAQERWSEAIAAFEKAQQTSGDGNIEQLAYAKYLIAMYLKLGDYGKAARIITGNYTNSYKAKETDSTWGIYSLFLGQLSSEPVEPTGDFAKWMSETLTQDEVRQKGWNDNLYSLAIGLWEYRQGNYERAQEYLAWDVESVPQISAVRLFARSMCQVQLGKLDDAQASYQAAIQTQLQNVPSRRAETYVGHSFEPLWYAWVVYDLANPQARQLLTEHGIDLSNLDPPTAAGTGRTPFIVLSGNGQEVARFSSLNEAVLGSSAGDTIEIRDNGPFLSEQIEIQHPLIVRAALGSRPVISCDAPSSPGFDSWITTRASLVLEGIELQDLNAEQGVVTHPCLIKTLNKSSLSIANCRFLQRRPRGVCVRPSGASVTSKNSEFIKGEGPAFWHLVSTAKTEYAIDNCISTGGALLSIRFPLRDSLSVKLKNSTVVGWAPCFVIFGAESRSAPQQQKVIISGSSSLLNVRNWVLSVSPHDQTDREFTEQESRELLQAVFSWNDDVNLFGDGYVSLAMIEKDTVRTPVIRSLDDWRDFWETSSDSARGGLVRFTGGELHSKTQANAVQLNPEDFRLRPDSAGYQAGPDGKDLGANVDFVGPGQAYERWKKTDDYQQWLLQTAELIHGNTGAQASAEGTEEQTSSAN